MDLLDILGIGGVDQAAAGKFEAPNWDQVSQKKVRDALLVLATTIPNFSKAFGTKAEVDPIRHLVGTAAGWGGNPDKDATYLNITPAGNDGTTNYKLTVKDVPVDAFWSVSLYNPEGYHEKTYDAYSINSITGKKTPTVRSRSSSAVATARFRTACRSGRAGITPCGSTGLATKF